VKHDVKW